MPARPWRNWIVTTMRATGIFRTAKIVSLHVWRSARRTAIVTLSRTGASPRATVQTTIVRTYSRSLRTKARSGRMTGRRTRNNKQRASVTTPERVSPALINFPLSSVSPM